MPTISTEGTPAASGSFETGDDIISDISIQNNSATQEQEDSIQNLHSRVITSSDLDFEGLNDLQTSDKMEIPITKIDNEIIKPTLSQVEHTEACEKLGEIAATENFLEKEVFHSSEDARFDNDFDLKPKPTIEKNANQIKFEDMTFKEEEPLPKVIAEDVEESPWLDVIGSGDIMKKIMKSGIKQTRPNRGQIVTVNLKGHLEDEVEVESLEDFSFTLGDAEVIQGLELAIPLMDKKETANILVKARFAYGELGREPDIPSNANINYTIELVDVFDEPNVESLSVCERMRIGSGKKDRGNFWFTRGDFSQAIVCYRRALEFLDDENSAFSDPKESSKQLLEDRLKVYNNLALAQLKVDAFDAAIISVDTVLRIQPENIKALFRKGKILAAQGNTDEAITCMRRALKLEPDTKIIQAELARLQCQKTQENASERELYRKMLGEQRNLVRSQRSSKFKVWSSFLGGIAAVVIGIFAYRQYHVLGRDLNFLYNSPYIEMVKDKVTDFINTVAAKFEQEQVESTMITQTANVETPTV